MPIKIFHMKRSNIAIYFIFILYGTWIGGLFCLHDMIWVWLAYGILGMIYGYFWLHQLGRIKQIKYDWPYYLLQNQQGEWLTMQCQSAFVSSWVLILYLQDSFSKKRKTVVIFSDALSCSAYQTLFLQLKYRVFLANIKK